MRKTKIVCTLGPATNDVEIMKQLIHNGMDAARINFSHGTYETHAETIAKLKQAREELNAPIPLILDTKGPEIRVKTFKEDKVRLEEDATFTLTTREVEGDVNIVSVTYADLPKDVHRGSRILIDDGNGCCLQGCQRRCCEIPQGRKPAGGGGEPAFPDGKGY